MPVWFKNRKLYLLLLIPAIGLLIFNSAYYGHYHKTKFGIIVSHAHPYNKSKECEHSPFSSHSHSNEELVFWDIISHSVLQHIVLVAVLALVVFEKLIRENKIAFQEPFFTFYWILLQESRGPPSCK